jgi:hypothetical protein
MLKKTLFVSFFLNALIVSLAFADVGIQVIDLQKKKMLVTYLWKDDRAGITQAVFPEKGYFFASGPIEILSTVERNSEKKLKATVVPPMNHLEAYPDRQSVLVHYPAPVPRNGSFLIEVSVQAKTEYISHDLDGNYVIKYKTTHTVFFKVPSGHEIINCNYPLFIYQINGSTVARVNKSTSPKRLRFKIRPYPSHSE